MAKAKQQALTKKEFLAILRENGGLFARTARAIEKKYNRTYSRQAVQARALKYPKELADIEEENIDVAEEFLHGAIRDAKNKTVQIKAVELYLKTKGRTRGYGDKLDITGNVTSNVVEMGYGKDDDA